MKYRETVSVACINFPPEWGNRAANLSKIKALSKQAAHQGNNIIIFPELALTGYECAQTAQAGIDGTKKNSCSMHKELAETIPGPSTNEITALARDLDVYIIFGMPEKDMNNPDILYISSVIIGPEGLLGTYRKLHLAPLPRFTDTLCFSPGNKVPVFETRYGKIGILICSDFYFYPELARIMALKGADLLVNTSASASGPGKPFFLVQQTGCRATENGVYAASANLVGKELSNSYYGHSVIAGPLNPRPAFIFAEGGETEEIVSATLSLKKLQARKEQLNWQKDRQTELINAELARLKNN
jgi:predicted amidohydrolase